MCCIADKKTKEDFREKMKKKRRKTFIAWKVIYHHGQSMYGCYKYSPGAYTADITLNAYNVLEPRGIHVYMDYTYAKKVSTWHVSYVIIPVVCYVKDLVMISGGAENQQAVLTKIRITKKGWKEAGLSGTKNC